MCLIHVVAVSGILLTGILVKLALFDFSDSGLFGWRYFAGRGALDALKLTKSLLDCDFLTETLKWISLLKSLQLNWSVLVQELIDAKVATTNLDLDLVTLNLDEHASLSKFVDTG